MQIIPKRLVQLLLLTGTILFLSSFNTQNPTCLKTDNGYTIDWQNHYKLKQSDFKANKKWSLGNTVANTYSGFGYCITDNNGIITGSIFVRFYCNKSWFKSDLGDTEDISYILKHEQLHFDICELFGRKLYKGILSLINSNKLSQRNIDKIQSKLEKQYSNYQKAYDKETNHSINVNEQRRWEKKVKNELEKLSGYSDYTSF